MGIARSPGGAVTRRAAVRRWLRIGRRRAGSLPRCGTRWLVLLDPDATAITRRPAAWATRSRRSCVPFMRGHCDSVQRTPPIGAGGLAHRGAAARPSTTPAVAASLGRVSPASGPRILVAAVHLGRSSAEPARRSDGVEHERTESSTRASLYVTYFFFLNPPLDAHASGTDMVKLSGAQQPHPPSTCSRRCGDLRRVQPRALGYPAIASSGEACLQDPRRTPTLNGIGSVSATLPRAPRLDGRRVARHPLFDPRFACPRRFPRLTARRI